MSQEPRRTRVLWANVITLMLSWVIWDPFQHAVETYFQAYLGELGMTPSMISVMFASGTFALSLASLIGGYLADAIGRKKLIVPLTYCVALCYLAYVFTEDPILIFAVYVSLHVFSLYMPAIDAIVADSLPEERRGLGYAVTSLSAIGFVAGPLIAWYVLCVHANDLMATERALFVATFVTGIIAATLRLIGLRETLERKPREITLKLVISEYRRTLAYITKEMRAYIVSRVLFVTAFGLTTLTQYYVIFYLRIPYDAWALALLLGNVVGYVISPLAGTLADRIGRKPVIVAGFSCICISTLLFALAPVESLPFVIAALIAEGASWGLAWVAYMAMYADLLPEELRGKGSAVIGLVLDIFFSAGSALSGIIYEAISPRMPFWSAVSLAVAGLILSVVILPETLGTRR